MLSISFPGNTTRKPNSKQWMMSRQGSGRSRQSVVHSSTGTAAGRPFTSLSSRTQQQVPAHVNPMLWAAALQQAAMHVQPGAACFRHMYAYSSRHALPLLLSHLALLAQHTAVACRRARCQAQHSAASAGQHAAATAGVQRAGTTAGCPQTAAPIPQAGAQAAARKQLCEFQQQTTTVVVPLCGEHRQHGL